MYFGAYFGATTTTVVVGGGGTGTTSTPVASPYTPSAPEYVDLTETAINRLCQYAKSKTEE